MSDILKLWLRRRLGVMINLNSDIFGHHARDGTLIAKVLHSYDIINDSQLKTIIHTHDPAISRVNLKYLKIWLHFIGIDCDMKCIHDISNGKGSTALRLFYQLYLTLENKDRLYYITQQQERERFIPQSTKFEVIRVPESDSEHIENPLRKYLASESETIEWYKNRRQELIDRYKSERQKCKEASRTKNKERALDSHFSRASSVETLNNTSDFKSDKESQFNSHRIPDDGKKVRSSRTNQSMLNAINEYWKRIKKRRNQEATVRTFKENMQRSIVSEISEQLIRDQEENFDEVIANGVLKQSLYEKRIMTHLCNIRRQKIRIAENRQIVENLMQYTRESELIAHDQRAREIYSCNRREFEDECVRFYEYCQKVHDEEIRKTTEENLETCKHIFQDLIDLSINYSEYKSYYNCMPESIWRDWKFLFTKGLPIADWINEQEEEGENSSMEGDTGSETTSAIVLADFDFRNYQQLEPPWAEHLPDFNQETKKILEEGSAVLGYVVHQLLGTLSSPSAQSESFHSMPEVEKRLILVRVPNRLIQNMRNSLKPNGIELIRLEDAINYCLMAYKEMKNDTGESIDRSSDEDIRKAKNVEDDLKDGRIKLQLSKIIPERNTNLSNSSDAASLGRLVHEFFSAGQPIPLELSTEILIGYIRSLKGIQGWAIINYPSNYEEMVRLESALTESKLSNITPDYDIISRLSRMKHKNEQLDIFPDFRESQLIPNPSSRTRTDVKSFITSFIQIIPELDELEKSMSKVSSVIEESVNNFYADRNSACYFRYSTFDDATYQEFMRLITSDIILTKEPSAGSFEETSRNSTEAANIPKPLAPTGTLTSFHQADEFLQALARVWKNMERNYIEGLKNIFYRKRQLRDSVVSYRKAIINQMQDSTSAFDLKNLFELLHQKFKIINQEIIVDPDLKANLLCELADFKSELFRISDQRKTDSNEIIKQLLQDGRTVVKTITLIDIYMDLIQIETDRCIETVQMLCNYYNSMQSNATVVIPKVSLQRLGSSTEKDLWKNRRESTKNKIVKSKRIKHHDYDWKSPPTTDCDLIEREIFTFLLDIKEKNYVACMSVCFGALQKNTNYVRDIVESLIPPRTLNPQRKKSISDQKGKTKKNRKSREESITDLDKGKYPDLPIEKHICIMYEITRVKMRLELIENAYRHDVTSFIKTIEQVFETIRENIVEKYERERNNISKVTDIFYSAIKKERPIQEIVYFEDKTLTHNEEFTKMVEEVIPDRFQIKQLRNLMKIFNRVAPVGTISKQDFYDIMRDMINLKERRDGSSLPHVWYKLRTEQVCQIIGELFGYDYDLIDWREFIIYGLEMTMPSVEQLLDSSRIFQILDPELRGIVTRDQFRSAPIWLNDPTVYASKNFHVLYSPCSTYLNLKKEAELEISAEINGGDEQSTKLENELSSKVSFHQFQEQLSPQETLRLILIRELLCDLFLVDDIHVNYLNLLFALCKDEDPGRGFTKSLLLEMSIPMSEIIQDEKESLEQKIIEDSLISVMESTNGAKERNQVDLDINKSISDDLEKSISDRHQHHPVMEDLDTILDIPSEQSMPSDIISSDWILNPVTATIAMQIGNREEPYWISKRICEKILIERLGLFAEDPEELEKFREELKNVYNSLTLDKFIDKDTVSIYQLLNHSFIRALLEIISNFQSKNISATLTKIINCE